MSKQCKLVDPGEACRSQAQSAQSDTDTNWDVCALCQEDTKERQVSPQEGSYKAIAECIQEFQKLNCLLINCDSTVLFELEHSTAYLIAIIQNICLIICT